jgi:tetratricopeptide (TPR) repeat protein
MLAANVAEKMDNIDLALNIILDYPDLQYNPEMLLKLSLLYIKNNETTKAKQILDHAITLESNASIAGQISSLRQDVQNMLDNKQTAYQSQSIEIKNKLLVIIDEKVKPYLEEASILIKEKQYDKALNILYFSLTIQDTHVAHFFIGSILLTKKQYELALKELEIAYRMNPRDPQLIYNLCYAYIKTQQYSKAKTMYMQYSELTNDKEKQRKLEKLLQSSKK